MAGEIYERRLPEIQLTQTLRDAVEKAIQCKSATDELRKQCNEILKQDSETGTIPTKLIRQIYNTLRNEGLKIFLHEMVENALLIPQTVVLPPRNPELEARIQKLKIEQENKEYERITRNLQPQGRRTLTFQEEVKSMNRQILGVFNFLITVAAGFAFGYKGTELLYGKVFAMQMLTGLTFGTVIFFVDLYFLLRYGL